ncbi:MAG TPA: aspartate/glutamate racemase family protein [Burkholderiales bacterium]|nr:aspartate/glutamate racemase family protein [Burkholderiales bacterium]
MKLLVMNPNITESVTRLIGDEARRAASPGTQITLLTAPFGVEYIETELEALIGAYASLECIAGNLGDHDAIVMAAFGDPGLAALRQAFDRPVVGLTEAALARAAGLARRFSIIAISPRIGAWYRTVVEGYGYGGRLASIRSLDAPIRDIGGVQDEHAARLQSLCEASIKEDRAEALILAGAPLAGLARRIAGLAVPLVDPIAAAVQQAERAPRPAFVAPPKKRNSGLPEAVRRLLSG